MPPAPNQPTGNDPNFLSPVTDPFGLTSSFGGFYAPTFVDIDEDGDLDAFVSNIGGNTLFFLNTGTNTAPSFTFEGTNLFGLQGFLPYNKPAFADIDGDGDLDIFLGTALGDTVFFRNTGTNTTPSFTFEGTNLFGLGNVGQYSTPTFADIDGDDDLDAFVGNKDGDIEFFRNTGAQTAPSFTSEGTNLFGLGNVGQYSTPTFVDIDGDDDLDAFVGNSSGDTVFFRNTGTKTAPTFTSEGTNLFGLTDVGDNASPTFADIDGDDDLDAFVGTALGDIEFFENDPVVTNQPPVAVDDAVTTDEDSLLSGNVLTNDSDAENDPLTVTEVNGNAADVGSEVTLTSGALLTLNSDGTFDYDPNGQFESLNNGETDSDSFTYTIDDGNGGTDTATVNVTIDGVTDNTAPPNSLESDYTIFSSNISTTEYTVELTNSQPVYKIDDTATNDSLNNFLTEAVLELGGTVVRNGTINENSLEHFGGNQNPSITENEAIDEVTIKIAGSGVGGQYKADFDNDADANAFQDFARDLLGTDPTKTQIFQFNGGTNGGNNNIRILANDEIVSLNPDLSDGLRTADSLEFKWSGSDTAGTQKRNNFDDFIGEMGDLFGGSQLTDADIHVIPTVNAAELTGTEVAISNGLGDTETWNFGNEQEAQNFLTFFDSAVDAFVVPI